MFKVLNKTLINLEKMLKYLNYIPDFKIYPKLENYSWILEKIQSCKISHEIFNFLGILKNVCEFLKIYEYENNILGFFKYS